MKLKVLISVFLLFTISAGIIQAQKKSKKIMVSGFVVDTEYHPVTGALILVDNKDTRIYTDNNGRYEIRLEPDAKVISVQSPDKQVKSELIEGRTVIFFSLKAVKGSGQTGQNDGRSEGIKDSVSGNSDSKNRVNGDTKSKATEVAGNENEEYLNIYEMIKSKVPGVDVSGQKIRIRGLTAMVNNNDPTFVVDGMIINTVDHIMPNMVQTISFLKGTEAAIYGSRAAYGVIVITLKKSARKTK